MIEPHQIIEHLLACGVALDLSCMRPLKRTRRGVPSACRAWGMGHGPLIEQPDQVGARDAEPLRGLLRRQFAIAGHNRDDFPPCELSHDLPQQQHHLCGQRHRSYLRIHQLGHLAPTIRRLQQCLDPTEHLRLAPRCGDRPVINGRRHRPHVPRVRGPPSYHAIAINATAGYLAATMRGTFLLRGPLSF